ncbi:hypothetical protein AK812_SmicGene38826 [Symbiodinium microadriaticum]|uniref:Uncharacterized protein n=1 Tax=Symbiodinium microadriaticum TaxID=2951 RepID=A0A1Q9CCR8_SYMMI|nr:hypothetical protein AK812_SmicGene38826 [Symbiodinium microadriaticum]
MILQLCCCALLCIREILPNAGFAVSGGRDGRICYWRLEDGACLRSVEVSEVCAGLTDLVGLWLGLVAIRCAGPGSIMERTRLAPDETKNFDPGSINDRKKSELDGRITEVEQYVNTLDEEDKMAVAAYKERYWVRGSTFCGSESLFPYLLQFPPTFYVAGSMQ